jgi:hypothetical protein
MVNYEGTEGGMLRKRIRGWFLMGAKPALTLNLFTLQAAPAGFVTVSGANFMLEKSSGLASTNNYYPHF